MFTLYYTAVTIDEKFVHILSRNSYLTARLYWERRAIALLEVDLVDLGGLTWSHHWWIIGGSLVDLWILVDQHGHQHSNDGNLGGWG